MCLGRESQTSFVQHVADMSSASSMLSPLLSLWHCPCLSDCISPFQTLSLSLSLRVQSSLLAGTASLTGFFFS